MAKDLNSGLLEQIQLAVRAGFELGASKLQVRCSKHWATLSPHFHLNAVYCEWFCESI